MNTEEFVENVRDKHIVIYGCDDGDANGLFYAEHEPRFGITFTTDTPDYQGISTEKLLEALYDHDIFTVTTTLHRHVGDHHSKDYTAEYTESTDESDVLAHVLGLYDNDDWAWTYHTEPLR